MQEKGINHRRNLILQMVNEQPNRKWSSYEIAEEARNLPWFQENMPSYSHMTAYRDWLAVKEETKDQREKLAEQFLVTQLDETEAQIASLKQDLDALGTIEEFLGNIHEDGLAKINDIVQFVKAKNTLLNALNRLFDKQADLVPINVPKKVQVDQRNFSFDYYLEVHQQHKHELNGNQEKLGDGIVEGEYEMRE